MGRRLSVIANEAYDIYDWSHGYNRNLCFYLRFDSINNFTKLLSYRSHHTIDSIFKSKSMDIKYDINLYGLNKYKPKLLYNYMWRKYK